MQQILYYILTLSGLTTFAIWLGKLAITKSFDLGIERYKLTLQKEIEEHKSSLSKLSLEHQVKFSKLHADRAEKIRILYEKVIELEQALIYATTPAQGPDYSKDLKRDDACFDKIKTLIHQLDLDRIYFTKDTISKFDSIIKESWEISFQMRKVRRYADALDQFARTGRQAPERYYSESDLWTAANQRTENEFKLLKEDLANEFRQLLGINGAKV